MNQNSTSEPRTKALAVYERLQFNRSYALDDVGVQSITALTDAWTEDYIARQEADGKSTSHSLDMIVPVFEQLAVFVPSMLQQRPGAAPETGAMQWRDPITGVHAVNPWSEPQDLTSQSIVRSLDPQLADHLKATAKGVSYSFLAKLRAEEEGRERLRTLVYGQKEHAQNPFVRPKVPKPNLTANMIGIAEFAKTHPPEVVAFYRREGETNVSLPWRPKNITVLALIGKHNPALRAITIRAEEIDNGWVQADLDHMQDTERSIAIRRKAEELLK